MTLAQLFHLVAVLGVMWAVICRARHMSGNTLALVRLQHGLLNAFALLSLVVPFDWAPAMLGAGALVFLALGSHRWRYKAPAGTKTMEPPPRPGVDRQPWAGGAK